MVWGIALVGCRSAGTVLASSDDIAGYDPPVPDLGGGAVYDKPGLSLSGLECGSGDGGCAGEEIGPSRERRIAKGEPAAFFGDECEYLPDQWDVVFFWGGVCGFAGGG